VADSGAEEHSVLSVSVGIGVDCSLQLLCSRVILLKMSMVLFGVVGECRVTKLTNLKPDPMPHLCMQPWCSSRVTT
jgi:hypothetical protein